MLILTKPVIKPSHLLHSQLCVLPHKSQLLLLYKQFFRLRNLIGNRYHAQKYTTILRRQFQRQDFNQRRRKVLGITIPLSEDEQIQRLETTLDFVFNSTVKKTHAEKVQYYNDIKRLDPDTPEQRVIHTLLQMDDEKPAEIKYDFTYNWIQRLSEPEIQTNKKTKTLNGYPYHYIGYKQQEVSLMRMNETLGLCL